MAPPTYALALYVTLPIVVCLLFLAGVLYIVCCFSRRYRINWYERSLIEGASSSAGGGDQDSEKAFLQPASGKGSFSTTSSRRGFGGSSSIIGGVAAVRSSSSRRHLPTTQTEQQQQDCLPPVTIGHGSTTVITRKVKPQYLDTGSMGSSSSSPTSSADHSPISSLSEAFAEKRVSFGSNVLSHHSSAYTNGGGGGVGAIHTNYIPPQVATGGSGGRRDTIHGIMSGGGGLQGRRDSATPSTGSGGEIRRDSAEFWVPPAVMQRKRAQSLAPTLGLFQQGDDTGNRDPSPLTPPQNTGELVFTYSPEKMSETVSMVQVPSSQRRRRASMQDALDPTTINARMYEEMMKSHQDSIASIEEEHLGSLNLLLKYNPDQGLLTVRLIQARDLVARDFSGTSDPYCKLCLLPNRKSHLQSKIHKNTQHPEFEEEFMFDLQLHKVSKCTLEVLLYDFDQFSRDECMGQVLLPLEDLDLMQPVVLWKSFAPYQKKNEMEDLGDMMFSLGYLPSAERLTVVVLKARNLRCSEDSKSLPNPFVKVTIISNNKRIKKKKTTTIRSTAGPVWNEALVFNLSKSMLKQVTLELVLLSDSLLGHNVVLGKVVIGQESSGDEKAHWNDMLNSKTAMARWHRLSTQQQQAS